MPFVTSAAEVWAGGPRREPPLAPGRQDNALRPPGAVGYFPVFPARGKPHAAGDLGDRDPGDREPPRKAPPPC